MKKRKIFIDESRISEVKMFFREKNIMWTSNPFYIDGGTLAIAVIAGAIGAIIVSVF